MQRRGVRSALIYDLDKGLNNNDQRSKSPRSKNTAVYVKNLPRDTGTEELVQRFSECGVIEEANSGGPKIKMYAHEDKSMVKLWSCSSRRTDGNGWQDQFDD